MGFQLGPIFIHYYGIILMAGAVSASFLAAYEARRWGDDSDFVWDALTVVLIGGVIGARIWHILTPPPSMVALGITTSFYLTHPLDAFAIWQGGLGIPGAVIGGAGALYWYTRRRKVDFGLWTDIAAPGLALGQAIGRWGNFVNQELYGKPTDLPWAIFIDPQHRVPGFSENTHFHPLFLYESLWNLASVFFLLWVGRRFSGRLRNGDVFFIYLITYPIGRFFLEFLRLDASQVAGLNANQTLMVIVAAVALAWLIIRHREPFETKAEVERATKLRKPRRRVTQDKKR